MVTVRNNLVKKELSNALDTKLKGQKISVIRTNWCIKNI